MPAAHRPVFSVSFIRLQFSNLLLVAPWFNRFNRSGTQIIAASLSLLYGNERLHDDLFHCILLAQHARQYPESFHPSNNQPSLHERKADWGFARYGALPSLHPGKNLHFHIYDSQYNRFLYVDRMFDGVSFSTLQAWWFISSFASTSSFGIGFASCLESPTRLFFIQ